MGKYQVGSGRGFKVRHTVADIDDVVSLFPIAVHNHALGISQALFSRHGIPVLVVDSFGVEPGVYCVDRNRTAAFLFQQGFDIEIQPLANHGQGDLALPAIMPHFFEVGPQAGVLLYIILHRCPVGLDITEGNLLILVERQFLVPKPLAHVMPGWVAELCQEHLRHVLDGSCIVEIGENGRTGTANHEAPADISRKLP